MIDSSEHNLEIQALEDQNAQLLALFLASQRLSSTLKLDEVQATILDIVVEFVGADQVTLWLVEDADAELRLSASRGIEDLARRTIPLGQGLIGRVVARGDEAIDEVGAVDAATGLPTLAAVPLRSNEGIAGAVALHRLLPHKAGLTEADHALLRLIAGQAAVALASARLHRESRSLLQGLRRLSRRIAEHVSDLGMVSEITVETIAGILHADVCQLYLVDEASEALVLRSSFERPDGASISSTPSGHAADRAGILARAVTEKRIVRGGAVTRSGRTDSTTALEAGGTAILAAPLIVGSEVIGALAVERAGRASDWSADDEETLSAATDQLAVGINNARLYARVEEDYFTMSTLFMAANRLHATLDLDEILRSARDILESLIGASTYAIVLRDETSNALGIAVAEGISAVQKASFRALVGQGLVGRVVKSGDAYIAPADVPPPHRVYGEPILACVPLRVENVIVGAIVINRLLPHKTGLISTDNDLFSLLAQHAATAILAARLFSRAEQKLVTLYDLSRLISASVSTEEILDLSLNLVAQVLRAGVVALFTAGQESEAFRLSHAVGVDNERVGTSTRLDDGAVAFARKTNGVLESDDPSTDQRFAGSILSYSGPTLVIPLRVSNSLVGVLAISDRQARQPFASDERRAASTMAGQIGLILQHTGLYQQAQHLAILLEREREALRSTNQNLNMAIRQLDTVIEHLSEGVVVVDAEERLIRVNEVARRLLGIEAESMETLESAHQSLDIQRADGIPLRYEDSPTLQTLRTGQPHVIQCRLRSSDGRYRDLEIGSRAILDSADQVALAVSVLRDVTDQQELDRAKDAFIATAAHELRGPLTAMHGMAQLLVRQVERSGAPGGQSRGLRVVEEQSNRLIRLVDHLLDVTRLELGRITLERAPVDLGVLVSQIARDAEAAYPGRHVEVVTEPSGIAGDWDASRLEQVVTNLIGNAFKFSPPDLPVTIEIRREGDQVHLEVRDRGPGVPADQLGQIFDRYAQSASGSQTGRGLGLGLYISRQIVEAHGGQIWAAQAREGGAAFHVLLPLDSTARDGGTVT